jgi:hypothetical protein
VAAAAWKMQSTGPPNGLALDQTQLCSVSSHERTCKGITVQSEPRKLLRISLDYSSLLLEAAQLAQECCPDCLEPYLIRIHINSDTDLVALLRKMIGFLNHKMWETRTLAIYHLYTLASIHSSVRDMLVGTGAISAVQGALSRAIVDACLYPERPDLEQPTRSALKALKLQDDSLPVPKHREPLESGLVRLAELARFVTKHKRDAQPSADQPRFLLKSMPRSRLLYEESSMQAAEMPRALWLYVCSSISQNDLRFWMNSNNRFFLILNEVAVYMLSSRFDSESHLRL